MEEEVVWCFATWKTVRIHSLLKRRRHRRRNLGSRTGEGVLGKGPPRAVHRKRGIQRVVGKVNKEPSHFILCRKT